MGNNTDHIFGGWKEGGSILDMERESVFMGDPRPKMRKIVSEKRELMDFFKKALKRDFKLRDVDKEMTREMKAISLKKFNKLKKLDDLQADLIIRKPFFF